MGLSEGMQAASVVGLLREGPPADAALVDAYYTLCIPFYREFLGSHWHTGWYRAGQSPSPEDVLEMERRLAAQAGLRPGAWALDVGCGIGGPTCHLASLTGAQMLGVGPNAQQLALARQGAAARGLAARVHFVRAAAEALPVADASVDAVFFFESACHFIDRARFFREAWRVLRPGGQLLGEDWLSRASGHGAAADADRVAAVERAWAIPRLGSLGSYVDGMHEAGLQVAEAVDLRDEMPLLAGFAADESSRREMREEAGRVRDPVRRQIIEALAVLGHAAQAGAFTVGRFRAVKPG